jgi:NADH:ubiquinone oxidoreductase subunit 6 (subunit J)
MNIQKIVGIAVTVTVLLIFAVFFYFIFSMITTDDFDKSWEMGQDLLAIFPIMIGAVILISVLGTVAARKAPATQKNTADKKKCIGCGTLMNKKEHSCPKCYTMQPVAPEDIRYIDHRQHNPPKK